MSEAKRTWIAILSPVVAVALFAVLQFFILPARAADAATMTRIEKLELQAVDYEKRISVDEALIIEVNKSISEIKGDMKTLINIHINPLVKKGETP